MANMAERSWQDREENYADGYTLSIKGTTATALVSDGIAQPVVLYSVSVMANAALGSGEVVLKDSSASADADNTGRYRVAWASGAGTFQHGASFPRGMVFNQGLIVSALTVTGAVNLTYKARY